MAFNSPYQGGFVFKRYYNSRISHASRLGYGWNHSFGFALQPDLYGDADQIKVASGSGRACYFEDERPYYEQIEASNHIITGKYGERSTITIDAGNYVWTRTDGKVYLFEISTGRLLSITDKNGNIQTLTYDAQGLLESVTDQAFGRTLTFHYDTNGLLSYITGSVTAAVPDGIWVDFGYDANSNLTSVTYADDDNGSSASGFEYHYEDPNDIHNLTSKYDLAGHFISSWTYDAQNRAYENVNREGKGVTIDYSDPDSVAVTDVYGITATYTITTIDRRRKIVAKDQAGGCSTCAEGVRQTEADQDGQQTAVTQYGYDTQDNLVSVTDANGNATTYTFDDADRLVERISPDTGTTLLHLQQSWRSGNRNPQRRQLDKLCLRRIGTADGYTIRRQRPQRDLLLRRGS
jgi:YD repeat-containing protein